MAPIAKLLNVSIVSATTYALDNKDQFLHIETIVDGEEKRKNLLQYLGENGIHRDTVVAYSDSIVDLPLLESVGYPIVVNGDRKLMQIAKKRKWSMLTV